MIARTVHAIAYDSIHDEFMVANSLPQSIMTFLGGADGDEAPIRVIQGPLTQLRNPDVLALDAVHDEIFVPLEYAILVFDRKANGNVAPLRVLNAPDDASFGYGIVIDPARNLLIKMARGADGNVRILLYDRTAKGDATPKAVIGGPKSGMRMAGGMIAITPEGWIVATQPSPGGDTQGRFETDSFVGVWNVQDKGDVPPTWKIGQGIVQRPKGVSLDVKNKSVIVSEKGLNAILTYEVPEIF
ncbi:MAG: hypothetical protein HY316_10250 [Acidobacteria bacterium]|nr:hypothetical protein [Acidobacteriota bacterium]